MLELRLGLDSVSGWRVVMHLLTYLMTLTI